MNEEKSYDTCRFAVQLAAGFAAECSADEDWTLEPIGVLNNLCSLVELVDEKTQGQLLQLVDMNAASPSRPGARRKGGLRKFFSVQEEHVDCISVSADVDVDHFLSESIKSNYGPKLQVSTNLACSTFPPCAPNS